MEIMNETPDSQGPEYPTKAHGSIPAFNSYEEEAAFWDSHSASDFKAETFPVQVRSTGIQERKDHRHSAVSSAQGRAATP